jgi:ribosomal protein L16/L10AE
MPDQASQPTSAYSWNCKIRSQRVPHGPESSKHKQNPDRNTKQKKRLTPHFPLLGLQYQISLTQTNKVGSNKIDFLYTAANIYTTHLSKAAIQGRVSMIYAKKNKKTKNAADRMQKGTIIGLREKNYTYITQTK